MAYTIHRQRRLTGRNRSFPATLLLVAIAACLLPFSTGCSAPAQTDADTIQLVTTILPLGDFARQVGGDRVNVTVMVPPGGSPHTHEPTPQQMIAVSEADIYVKTGSGIEFELV